MEIRVIREAVRRQPFEPFTIRTADGVDVHIPHPDFIALGQTGRRVIVLNPDDSVSHIDPLLIVSLNFVYPQANNDSNNTNHN